MSNTITSTALSGIYDAYKRINERTERISQFAFAEDDTSLVSDLVGLKTDIYTVKANSKVIAVDKELTNSILDILA